MWVSQCHKPPKCLMVGIPPISLWWWIRGMCKWHCYTNIKPYWALVKLWWCKPAELWHQVLLVDQRGFGGSDRPRRSSAVEAADPAVACGPWFLGLFWTEIMTILYQSLPLYTELTTNIHWLIKSKLMIIHWIEVSWETKYPLNLWSICHTGQLLIMNLNMFFHVVTQWHETWYMKNMGFFLVSFVGTICFPCSMAQWDKSTMTVADPRGQRWDS